ncbi:hypothetical protein TNCV_3196921 [Trichonephila clavipes]|nr:hypothetical protein TNCV_3196921 [Trichonephila clavipes]
MPLSRMENTTFVKILFMDYYDMGLRTVLTVRTLKEKRLFNAYSVPSLCLSLRYVAFVLCVRSCLLPVSLKR